MSLSQVMKKESKYEVGGVGGVLVLGVGVSGWGCDSFEAFQV